MKSLPLLLIAAALAATACKKDKDSTPAGTTFTIDSPAEGYTYLSGALVQVHATIDSPDTLHGYEMWVIARGTTDTLLRSAEHIHGRQIVLTKGFTNTQTADTECEMTLKAVIDHNGNTKTSSVRRFTLKKP